MFKDFENTKRQLSELADIVNKFKSEQVQLRLLELLFDAKPQDSEGEEKKDPKSKTKVTRKRKNNVKKVEKAKEKKTPSTMGPQTVLLKLYDEGFFSGARTIRDICTYADLNLARKIKPNDISGKLARMVRNGELSREKNADNQYEYTKP